ncbi:hypothetical protein J4G48_0004940 [Bradyrhizobium barranii subsp. apii]|uniref:hypothetical protein n=1 Tax=Bradyrhizobium barranii TaxID=2992140 RepID=UPI001AA0ED24|nr:hypothetical protein [Bradyrhizobium barranii]UPU01326.1 hypothetical protein J4G48_0004940 [Bradyrhizobium barranii subsp. apii]
MDGARYLEGGRLTIFRRNGTYYARLRLSPGKYVTRSLKTTVEENAVQAGRRLLFQLEHRAEQGLPSKSKSFAAVIDDYIRFRERDYGLLLSNGNFVSFGGRCASASTSLETLALRRVESCYRYMFWSSLAPVFGLVRRTT